jgi:hypothetical protein
MKVTITLNDRDKRANKSSRFRVEIELTGADDNTWPLCPSITGGVTNLEWEFLTETEVGRVLTEVNKRAQGDNR